MGSVAATAAIDTKGGVFKEKGAALVGVALDAGLLIGLGVLLEAGALAHAPGGGGGAVGVVAVGALHGAFVDTVFEGHGELRLDVGVAAITEVFLRLGQEMFGGSGLMNGVAVGADDIGLGVGAVADVVAGPVFAVAGEAVIECFARGESREGDDEIFFAAGADVGTAGTVAAFAAAFGLGVGVTEERLGLRGVTGAAGLGPDVGIFGLGFQQAGEQEEAGETNHRSQYKRSGLVAVVNIVQG